MIKFGQISTAFIDEKTVPQPIVYHRVVILCTLNFSKTVF